jgi:Zn-dependent M28 family amino/carboxypeptidase
MLNFLARAVLVILAILIAGFLALNARSLYEGIFFYVARSVAYQPTPLHPVSRSGRFASLYDLVRLTNNGREDYILAQLEQTQVLVTKIPVSGSPIPNLLVRFKPEGPYSLFSAHYDKYYDKIEYQGASDNTAADSVLLASIIELARQGYRGSAAFLFVAAEETGLQGSAAFVEYARSNGIAIREDINFDDLGRSRLAIRPSAHTPGFIFFVPLYGDVAFDGSAFRPSPTYPPANPRLTQALLRVQPDIQVLERFTALSDSNTFQSNGIDAVSISSDDMRYLELTWDTYYDHVELVDEQNLDLAFDLITRYAQQVDAGK